MGFKARPASKYAGAWIRIPHSDRDFATVAAGVTLASTISELKPPGALRSVASTTIEGQHVVGVKGTKSTPRGPGVVILYGRAAGSPLPVEERGSYGTARLDVTLGRWNEPVRVVVPKHSTPISKTGLE